MMSSASCILTTVLLLPSQAEEFDGGKILDEVQAAWEARAKKVVSARIRWTTRTTHAQGSLNRSFPNQKERQAPQPPEDVIVQSTTDLTLKGNFFRITADGDACLSQGQVVKSTQEQAFDGSTEIYFHPPTAMQQFPSASVRARKQSDELRVMPNYPVLFFARPFHTIYEFFDKTVWRAGNVRARYAGKDCLVVKRAESDGWVELWLDPGADYIVRRYMWYVKGRVATAMAINYRETAQGWIPSGWDITFLDDKGALKTSHTCSVQEFQINPSIDDAIFTISFPPGTWVHDERGDQSTRNYIVKEGGVIRHIQPHEITASYEQLISTESGMAFKTPPSRGPGFYVALAVIGTGVLLLLVYALRNRWLIRRNSQ